MAMFDAVRKGFQNATNLFEGKREITEKNIADAVRMIRMALFEADVNVRVVKRFVNAVKKKALGEIVHVRAKHQGEKIQINPGEVFIKICHDELEALMGPPETELTIVQDRLGPTIILMVGLQGSGKTTTTGKLARWLMHHHQMRPLLVACDVYRPAAIEQLKVLGDKLKVPVFVQPGGNPPDIAVSSLSYARKHKHNVVLIDTAGRLAVDDLLMMELEELADRTQPHNILLVVDAMIGQDAVNTAKEFNDRLELDGFIMTKLDGDARGGAALSIKEVTKKPIKFIGIGEKMDALQAFQPSGFADRILGMGDIRSLVGRMENVISQKEAKAREKDAHRMLKGDFDLYDFLDQIRTIKKLGSLGDIIDMLPGMQNLGDINIDDYELIKIEAMIQSMTKEERKKPSLITNYVTRQRRIARGSGRLQQEVVDLIQRFNMMRDMLQSFGGGGGGLMSKLPGLKQINQLRNIQNMDVGQLMKTMGGMQGMQGMMQGMEGMEGMEGMQNMMQNMQSMQQPQLPKGFSQPGIRMKPDSDATKSRISKEKAKRNRQKARKARKNKRQNKK